jgi:hypothetical protein
MRFLFSIERRQPWLPAPALTLDFPPKTPTPKSGSVQLELSRTRDGPKVNGLCSERNQATIKRLRA